MNASEVFKALGDPVRLRIIEMIAANGETCVCKIVEELAMTQPAISQHLAKLRYAGILTASKRGQWVYYSLKSEVLQDTCCSFIQGLIDKYEAIKEIKSCC